MKQEKVFCDVCKKEITNLTSMGEAKAHARYFRVGSWIDFDVCLTCWKKFKKWRKSQGK